MQSQRFESHAPVLELEESARVVVSGDSHRSHLDPVAQQPLADEGVSEAKIRLDVVLPLLAWKINT